MVKGSISPVIGADTAWINICTRQKLCYLSMVINEHICNRQGKRQRTLLTKSRYLQTEMNNIVKQGVFRVFDLSVQMCANETHGKTKCNQRHADKSFRFRAVECNEL